MPSGRFAPSPSGRLHLGNLRTALLAWLFARSDDCTFGLRFEDLDSASVRAEHYQTQADDLRLLGLDWDGEIVRQTDRLDHYETAITQLTEAGLTYPCYCSRREIREATRAPNGPWSHGHYPGTCRDLTRAERAERSATGRPPSLRILGTPEDIRFNDVLCGPSGGPVDDTVIRRFDGTPAYNLVVVVDDVAQGIELVVRAADLLDTTPRQLHIADLLDLTAPAFAHVPLVLGPTGDRLAKRDGAVTLADRMARGESPKQVLGFLAATLGLAEPGEPVTADDLISRFDPKRLPNEALTLDTNVLDLETG